MKIIFLHGVLDVKIFMT